MPDALIVALLETVSAAKESHAADVAPDEAYEAAQAVESWAKGADSVRELPAGFYGSYNDAVAMAQALFVLWASTGPESAYKTLYYADFNQVEPGFFLAGMKTDYGHFVMKLPLCWWQYMRCTIRSHSAPGAAERGPEAIRRILMHAGITAPGSESPANMAVAANGSRVKQPG